MVIFHHMKTLIPNDIIDDYIIYKEKQNGQFWKIYFYFIVYFQSEWIFSGLVFDKARYIFILNKGNRQT